MTLKFGLNKYSTATVKVGEREIPLRFGADMAEFFAAAFINAELNQELRTRVKAAIRGATERNNPMDPNDLIAERVVAYNNLPVLASAPNKILAINRDPSWKRTLVAVQALSANGGLVQVGPESGAGTTLWEISPGGEIQIPFGDSSELYGNSVSGTDDLVVWEFGYGVPPLRG
jgi:hypothetical protein